MSSMSWSGVRQLLVAVLVLLAGEGMWGRMVPAISDLPLEGPPRTHVDAVPSGLKESDWQSIRAVHTGQQYNIVPASDRPGVLRARTPSQQWTLTLDPRGFEVSPDSGGWTWGLQLEQFGTKSALSGLSTPATVTTDGQKATYHRTPEIDEWLINANVGLEHGFTLHSRPLSGDGPVVLDFTVRGGLTPSVHADGHGISFVRDDVALLNYAGLTVFDARGRTVSAWFEPVEKAVRLLVDDTGAEYPLTIDPIAQQAYLKPSNTGLGDWFGQSVAVSGDTVVVGAQLEDSNASGVNGNQNDNSLSAAGAVYVFVRNGGVWSQQAYLKASNPGADDEFGVSVALSGDTLVVGAHGEDSDATGINGDQANNAASGAGAAYVFVRTAGVWSQQAYLKPSNTKSSQSFGVSADISGDTVVVGAFLEASSATGVNGDESLTDAPGAGAVYVFVRDAGTWSQQAFLKASNTEGIDFFGGDVAISQDTVVIGAAGDDSSNGNPEDNSSSDAGAAYVFVRNGDAWSQQAYLKAFNAGAEDEFGGAVDVSGDSILVGARLESSSATGINGDGTRNDLAGAGAAYVFERSGTNWTQQAYVKASNTGFNDLFGTDVSISGDTAVVGAQSESSNASGVDGDQSNDDATSAGAAYVFVRSGGSWIQREYLKASNTDSSDFFGEAVAVSDDLVDSSGTVVVGAFQESSNGTGVNGNETDDSLFAAGAAYTFLVPPPGPTAMSVAPSSGSGANAVFGYAFDDPNGFSDIAYTITVINNPSATLSGCTVVLIRSLNWVFLLNDSSSAWIGPSVLGSGAAVENSQCVVNVAASSASGIGTSFTLNLAVSFKGTFAGTKENWAIAVDGAGHESGWQMLGTFDAINIAPTLASITPSGGAGASQTFTYQVTDPNGHQDINAALVVINSAVVLTNGCVLYVDRLSRGIFLLNDLASAWMGPIVAGATGTLQNSQCTVTAGTSSVGGNLNTLTVALALSFKGPFSGLKFNLASASDSVGAPAAWNVATWVVP